eukprot:m.69217 g.69217  ORF g.69217 m.69217 type:complete len:667 (+) comp35586_c0_seq1:106-2106(+)
MVRNTLTVREAFLQTSWKLFIHVYTCVHLLFSSGKCASKMTINHYNPGVVTSPNYPGNYARNSDCETEISASKENCLKFNLLYLDVEKERHCDNDRVEIKSGDSTVRVYCGHLDDVMPNDRLTYVDNSSANIIFKSDGYLQKSGFRFKIQVLPSCSSSSEKCNSVLRNRKGSITSKNYPLSYENNVDCRINIQLPKNCRIQLHFTDVELEHNRGCTFDYVEIYDGKYTAGRFCHSQNTTTEINTGSTALVHFRTDKSETRKGFRLTYTSKCFPRRSRNGKLGFRGKDNHMVIHGNTCNEGEKQQSKSNMLCTCIKRRWSCCRQRKEFTSMSKEEKQLYVEAVQVASSEPPLKYDYDFLLRTHREEFNKGIHSQTYFLPWHRWFILQYENLLRRVSRNVTVPYWDWSLVAQTPFTSPIWGKENYNLGGNATSSDSCVRTGPFRARTFALPNGQCLERNFCESGKFAGPVEVAKVLNIGSSDFAAFEEGLRINLHANVHVFIGGTMSSSKSSYAPEFFLHHAFIDKLWNDWQQKGNGNKHTVFNEMEGAAYAMPGADQATPSEFVDIANQPGDVNVCYEKQTQGDAGSIESALENISSEQLAQLPHSSFSSLSPLAKNLFGVSDKEWTRAESLEAVMRKGPVSAGPLLAHLKLKLKELAVVRPKVLRS